MSEILNILGSLGFNWHVALANFVNFLIILFILNKFFFGSIRKTIKHRGEVIERGLKDAENAKDALSNAEKEKLAILVHARNDADNLVLEGETKAHVRGEEIRADAERESKEKLAALLVKEQSLKEKVEKAFGERAPELVANLYQKTLLREMTEAENNALILKIR